jgi:hypothetical protein
MAPIGFIVKVRTCPTPTSGLELLSSAKVDQASQKAAHACLKLFLSKPSFEAKSAPGVPSLRPIRVKRGYRHRMECFVDQLVSLLTGPKDYRMR